MEEGDLQPPQAGWPWRLIHRPAAPAEEHKSIILAWNTLQSKFSRVKDDFLISIKDQLMISRNIHQHWVLLVNNPGRQGNAKTGCCTGEREIETVTSCAHFAQYQLHHISLCSFFSISILFWCCQHLSLRGLHISESFVTRRRMERRCWFILNCF